MRLAVLLLLTSLTAAPAASVIEAQQPLPAGTQDSTVAPPQDSRFAQAEAALEKPDYDAALPILTQLSEKYPDNANVAYDLGYTQEGLHHDTEAEAGYRRALSLNPDYPEAHVSLGLLLAREGHPDTAHEHLAAAAGSATASPAIKAAADRALAQLDQKSHPDLARDELLAALKLSSETPADILLGAQLADAAAASDPSQAPAAEQAYRRYLALNPTNLPASAGLAHVLQQQGKAAEAESILLTALAQYPNNPALTAQLISVYLVEKKLNDAVPLAEAMHTAHPQDTDLTRLLAHLYDQLGQADKSDPLYVQLIAQNPTDPTLLDDRAAALIQLGKPAEAEEILKKALILPGDFPTREQFALAASHLAFAASQNNDPNTVLQALQLRAKVLPQSASSLYLQATATDSLHQSKAAAGLYRQFLAAANGQFPEEEAEARKRITALERNR